MSDTPVNAPAPRRRWRTITRWSLVTICLVALVASSVVAWNIRRSFPDTDGELRLPGLSAPVEVVRDGWGVPQLYADTDTDLLAAQGYLHAQDRFFEMDFRRHVTSGRLSELFGAGQVETDATIRTMGWRRTAEAEWDLLDPTTKSYFQAYADGVNAYLADKSPGEVSLEYTILGLNGLDVAIEPWTPADSLAWLKAMAWDLRGNYSDELARAGLSVAGLTPEQIDQLYPAYPSQEHAPIVAQGTVVDGVFDADATGTDPDARRAITTAGSRGADALADTARATDAIDPVLGASGADGIGSNSWVVSGDLTDTGKPILANDPHLGPAMPSVWYQLGLHCRHVDEACPFDVAGFSFSGVPGVMIGHNARVAWGFTNLGPDVTDFYLERLDGDRYLVDGEWHDLDVRDETIEVFDGEDVTITVRSTGHGPLMSDRGAEIGGLASDPPVTADDDPDGEYGVALRWTALDPGHTAEAIFELNTATDFTRFRAAAAKFEVPAQNLIYADVDGNIGYQSPGRIPIRENGDGVYPAPGWDSGYDWTGFIPFEELPSVYNPSEGFVVTANNEVIGSQYPYLLTHDWAYGYRSQRIRDMITGADGPISVADMAAMQLDSTNTQAPPIREALLAATPPDDCDVCRVLDDWDGTQDVDSAGAAVFNAAWSHLLLDTFDELPEAFTPGGGERWSLVTAQLLSEPDSPWWDDITTPQVEDADAMLTRALTEAQAELRDRFGDDPTDWRWGEMHTLTVTHQSLGTSGIGWIEAIFNAPTVEAPGGDGLVDATGWNPSVGYEVDAVPSMRMVVDLSDFDNSRWINLTGNSGHAYHPHYRDQLPLWRDGETLPWHWSSEAIAEATEDTLILTP